MNKLLLTKAHLTEAEKSQLQALGFEVIVQSFIHFEAVDFTLPVDRDFQWIFFSSPRAFDFFSKGVSSTILQEKKIACIGRKTAEHISNKGIACDFIGQRSGEVKTVAQDFKSLVKTDTVLFPISQRSNQSMQAELRENQIINLQVYTTLSKLIHLTTEADFLVFTSPSNAEAYLKQYTINPTQKIIAWGSTTKSYLESLNYTCLFTLEESSVESLAFELGQRPELLA
ncbi:uroporphyrinogen-III synthase [Lishizhenia tianjinensis]|uniref:Uroporphyrinogen-III synthase n=1 Tax=Lishizhenia tianjinensis TaxID=477690 RepID=A0A1I7B3E8_9FLAO|nr:uroporphyrinogen-III synthase [Lishizhenia tianjinensis]SFT81723.1 uroporphyrinogen-III synthase [Lishizhenia tianjinensis]